MNRTLIYQSLLLVLLVSGIVLISGCNVTEIENEELEEERLCPADNPMFPPLKNCYVRSDSYPSWSPDGKYIAYISTDREPFSQEAKDSIASLGLYVYELATDKKALLHEDGLYTMSSQAWSPDGQWLTFGLGKQIYKIRADGSELTRLTKNDDREYFDPAWSPDGEWIAYNDRTVDGVENTGTWMVDSTGLSNKYLYGVAHPVWSSDGNHVLGIRTLAYNDVERIFIRVYIESYMQPDTLSVRENAINTKPDYSSDDAQIVFQSQRNGDIDIWKINANGTGLKRLTSNGGEHPAWSPGGSTIAYVNIDYFEGRGKIWLMDSDGTNRRPMRR